ncbi:MAG: hypothetical protein ACI8RD_013288 [Bacillariaceae sp.]|jgi:hypothetical protein
MEVRQETKRKPGSRNIYINKLITFYDDSNIAALIVSACFLAASEVPNQNPL